MLRHPLSVLVRHALVLAAIVHGFACGDPAGQDPTDASSADNADGGDDVLDANDGADGTTNDGSGGGSDGTDGDPRDDDATPPVPVPFEAFAASALERDSAFLQETNHTTPEVDPTIGPLAGVFVPPAGVGLPTPTQVRVDGLVVSGPGPASVVPTSDGSEILQAGGVGDAVLAVTTTGLQRWTGSGFEPIAGAGALEPRQFVAIGGVAWIRADDGPETGAVWRWDPTEPAAALAFEARVDLLGTANGLLVTITGDRLDAYAPATAIGDPMWSVALPGVAPATAVVGDLGLPADVDIAVLGPGGFAGVALGEGVARRVDTALFQPGRVPLTAVTAGARAGDGGLIVGGPEGAARVVDWGDGEEWRVYPAERWLPSEDVRGVAAGTGGELAPIWFATAGGLATVTAERVTLEQKLAPFIDRIVERHSREGAVSDSHLLRRGDLSSNVPWDSDNDGGWTAYWLLTECYRWKVTGANDARVNFDQALDAMLRLHDLTGTDHFLARSVIRREGCQLDDCDSPDDGEWFLSPDEEFWVKGDTSNDEVIAHAFMMGPAYDLCATDTQRPRIARHIGNIVRGLVENDFQLLDIDGDVTTYGRFDPAYVNDDPGGRFGDGGMRSAELLALLTLADYLDGDPEFLEAKRSLIEEHGYADNAVRASEYPGARHSGDRDELSTMAWFVLLRYEPDPVLRAMWQDGWARLYAATGLQQAAWWDVANAVLGGPSPRMDHALRWLRRAPVDLIRWNVHNKHRSDLVEAPGWYRFVGRMRSDGRIIPYDERACERWNTNQFRLDGGHDGWTEMDGADITAPYWMARYYGYIAAE